MKDKILESIQDSIKHLNEKYDLINQAHDEPKLILTNLFNPDLHQPYYDLFMLAINKNGIKYHEIQKEFQGMVIEYLKQLDSEIDIHVAYSSFPSRLIIKYKNKPFLSFDIYNHIFGDFRNIKNIEWYKKDIEDYELRIKKLEERISKYQKLYDRPITVLRSEYEKFSNKPFTLIKVLLQDTYYFMVKNKEIKSNIIKKINTYNKEIESINKAIDRSKQQLQKAEEIAPVLESKFNEWQQRFLDWGYEEKDRRSSQLY